MQEKKKKKGEETSESSKFPETSDKMRTIECIELVLLEYHKKHGKDIKC